MSKIEKAIRDNFPGANNTGLRAELRAVVQQGGSVMGVAKRVALTAGGLAGLEAVQEAVEVAESDAKAARVARAGFDYSPETGEQIIPADNLEAHIEALKNL